MIDYDLSKFHQKVLWRKAIREIWSHFLGVLGLPEACLHTGPPMQESFKAVLILKGNKSKKKLLHYVSK